MYTDMCIYTLCFLFGCFPRSDPQIESINFMGPSGPSWAGPSWALLGSHGPGPNGPPWAPLLAPLGPYGPGPYGTPWALLSRAPMG